METISRIKFSQVDEMLADDRQKLAKEARDLLGYKTLANTLIVPEALMFTLRKLGIEPLCPFGVQDYKAKKAKPGMWSDVKLGLRLLGAAVAALTAAGWLNRGLDWKSATGTAFAIIGLCVVVLMFTVFGLCFMFDSNHTNSHRTTREWEKVPLRNFDAPVPEYVLLKAVQIRKECAASLSVEYLVEQDQQGPRRLPDPFLIATLGDEHYYIDVWDEKEYEREM